MSNTLKCPVQGCKSDKESVLYVPLRKIKGQYSRVCKKCLDHHHGASTQTVQAK